MAPRGLCPAASAAGRCARAALHRDLVEQYPAGDRDERRRHLAGARDSVKLCQRPSGRGNLFGIPQYQRQRIVLAQGPALSAVPARQAGRLERRLGSKLDVAIIARAISAQPRQLQPPTNGSTVGQDIKLKASDGFQSGGYRADPAGTPKGAIVVIQEIFGVNHHIRAVCDRVAAAGYVAVAPSIFDRIEPNFQCGYSPDEIAVARKFVANPDWAAMLLDTQAAIDAVKSVGPVGIIGFCLGGSVAYAAANKLAGP